MRKLHLSAAIALTVILSASALAWGAQSRPSKVTFVPPAETGTIFVVIDYARSGGRTQPTYATIDWGSVHRNRIVKPPYQICSTTSPAGFVLKIRHNRPDSVPLTLTTTGTIVRGPFQGEIPQEVLHACYKLVL